MPTVTVQSRLQRDPSILSTDINGETVMLNHASSEYIKLDLIGADIWERLAQPQIVTDLIAELAKHYQGDPTVIQSDVLAFLEDFKAKGLLLECD